MINHAQDFPAEYFTGADVSIYFGEKDNMVLVDDITSIQFRLYENIRPFFGFSSYTFDEVARGNRMVQGQFRMAFRSPGDVNLLLKRYYTQDKIRRVNTQREEIRRFNDFIDTSNPAFVRQLQQGLLNTIGNVRDNYVTQRDIDSGVYDRPLEKPYASNPLIEKALIYLCGTPRETVWHAQQEALANEHSDGKRRFDELLWKLVNQVLSDYTVPIGPDHREGEIIPALFAQKLKEGLTVNGEVDFFTELAIKEAREIYGLDPQVWEKDNVDRTLLRYLNILDDVRDIVPNSQNDDNIIEEGDEEEDDSNRIFFNTIPFTIFFNYGNRNNFGEQPRIRVLKEVYLMANGHWVGHEQGRVVDEIYEFIAKDMERETDVVQPLHPYTPLLK